MFLCSDECGDGNVMLLAPFDHDPWRHTECVGDQPDGMRERNVQQFLSPGLLQVDRKVHVSTAGVLDVADVDVLALE